MTDVFADPDATDDEDDDDISTSESAKREIRRQEIWSLYVEGISIVQIAKSYKVSRRTIYNDVAVMKSRLQETVRGVFSSPSKQFEEIGETLGKLDLIFSNAMMDYRAMTADLKDKDRSLNTALRAIGKKAELQIAVGLLPKAAERHEHTLTKKVSFTDRLGEEHPLAILDAPQEGRRLVDLAARVLEFSRANPDVAIELDADMLDDDDDGETSD